MISYRSFHVTHPVLTFGCSATAIIKENKTKTKTKTEIKTDQRDLEKMESKQK